MIKSKYAIELEIEDNIYAIYNNLIMKPIFVDKKFLLNINTNELTAQEIDELKKIGYFIEDSTIDKKILETYEKVPNKKEIISQISMNFEEPVKTDKKYDIIKKTLDEVDPLETSPMQALNILYELKKELKGE